MFLSSVLSPAAFAVASNRPRRIRLSLLVLAACLLALIGWRLFAQVEGERGIPPIASTGDFEVGGITVNVTGKSPQEAREKGWKEAQRKGWEILYARTHGGAKAPELPDSRIASMVSAVVVEHEEIAPRRYIASLGVIFDRARAGEVFGSTNDVSRSAPMLVVPILYSGGVGQLYEVRTPWQRTWAEFRTAQSPVDYVRPYGGGWESLILNAGQMGRRSRSWWRVILDEFGASDVLFPVARLERQWPGGPVKGTFTARFGPDKQFLGSFTLTAENEEALPRMLESAAKRLDGIYAKALADGRLNVDETLDVEDQRIDPAILDALTASLTPATAETPQPQGPTPQPTVAAISTYTVQVATPDPASVDSSLAALRSIPGVQSASVSSIAIGGTSVLRVGYGGDLTGLASSLQARGWSVTQGSDALRITR